MDLFIYDSSSMTRYDVTTHCTIVNDLVNKGMWDPTEIMNVSISGSNPEWVKFVTPNGVSAVKITP